MGFVTEIAAPRHALVVAEIAFIMAKSTSAHVNWDVLVLIATAVQKVIK